MNTILEHPTYYSCSGCILYGDGKVAKDSWLLLEAQLWTLFWPKRLSTHYNVMYYWFLSRFVSEWMFAVSMIKSEWDMMSLCTFIRIDTNLWPCSNATATTINSTLVCRRLQNLLWIKVPRTRQIRWNCSYRVYFSTKNGFEKTIGMLLLYNLGTITFEIDHLIIDLCARLRRPSISPCLRALSLSGQLNTTIEYRAMLRFHPPLSWNLRRFLALNVHFFLMWRTSN